MDSYLKLLINIFLLDNVAKCSNIMSKIIKLFFTLSMMPFNSIIAQISSDAIVGDWITTERNAIIRCYKEGNRYYGKVLWYAAFKENEEGHTIDPIDNVRFINTICMKNFIFNKNEWSEGEIIDAYHHRKYSAFARINSQNQLEVIGYILFRWLSQTLTLERASFETVDKYSKNLFLKQ